jgi:hypothetical protein
LNTSVHTVQYDETGRSAVVFGELPPPPLLMAFTRKDDLYQIWRVDRKF